MDTTIGNSFYLDIEVRFMEFLQNVLGEKAISIISFFSEFGEELLLILILGFLFWCYDKKTGIYVGTNVVLGIVLNPMIKNIFWRRRPYFDHETIKCLRPVDSGADIYDINAQGFSFPSGHSTNSVTTYGSIARSRKSRILKVLAFVFPILIGLSRMTVGVHYPTDVLCGWLLGLVIIFVTPVIFNKFGEEKRWLLNLCIFLFCCIGLLYCKTSDYFSGLGLMAGFFISIEYEKRFVHFENTKNPIFCITRLVCGSILYLALNAILKLPFDPEFLASSSLLSEIVRFFRYAVVGFFCIGYYPHIFKLEKKLTK